MTTAHLQADIGNVIVHVSFWVCTMFIPVISMIWPWWKDPLARILMSLEILLAVAFLQPELRLLGVMSSWLAWFELVVVALIPPRTAWLGWQIWRLQRVPPENISAPQRQDVPRPQHQQQHGTGAPHGQRPPSGPAPPGRERSR